MYYHAPSAYEGRMLKNADTAETLIRLRQALDRQIPKRTVSETLLLATWNIREFDSRRYGVRSEEALYCIAEMVSRFDLIAIQEVRQDLQALEKLQQLLGGWWKFIFTDVTEGSRGNQERMAFLYDTRKMVFGGLSGEIVIPDKSGQDLSRQLARTPFIVGFKAGWFHFMIATVHILYGKSVAEDPNRVKEIEDISNFLKRRATDRHAFSDNLILLGDFNIFNPDDVTMQAINHAGFEVPQKIQRVPSNAPQNKYYDQIAFYSPGVQSQLAECQAGVFNMFNYIFRNEDEEHYIPLMGKSYHTKRGGEPRSEYERMRHYRQWRTYQISDHLPMWCELKIDWSDDFLQEVAKG